MRIRQIAGLGLIILTLALLAGCASYGVRNVAHFQTGESIVLVGQQPTPLAFTPEFSQPMVVRNTYRDGLPHTVRYEVGRDFVLAPDGGIQRTVNSRIPDFATNILYGREDFNHSQFPGYGNLPYFVYVDYCHREKWRPLPVQREFSAAALPATRKKLRTGQSLRIVAYGDSITAGGEASEPGLIFWSRWAEALRQKYPRATIETINGATGGDSTVQGLQRLQSKVLDQKPDLVLVGFGMNDHNREGYGVPLKSFAENLRLMIDRIRAGSGAEIILFSAFPPNPKWHFGSHNMDAYAETTALVAREKNCAFADVYHNWQTLAARKRPEDLLANNINHPNDFGHWIYFQSLRAMGL